MAVVEGKVVLITGGTGGLGFAMVKELLRNGAKGIAIVDLHEEAGRNVIEEIESSFGPGKAIFVKADVTIKKDLEDAFESTIKRYKQLDIVINNAGIINEVQWEKTIAINLTAVMQGSYLAMQKYLPKYKSSEEGIIVNTASILGLNTIRSAPAYCASKHGVVALGEALGGEEYYKRYKVRVLTICPGVIDTPLVAEFTSDCFLLVDQIAKELAELNPVVQTPVHVAKALIKVLNEGKNGSLWMVEDGKPVCEVVVPDRKLMRQ